MYLCCSQADVIVDLEAKFSPNLLNSCIYLISLSQQVSTFAINFQGRPFREGITENSALYYGLLGVAAVAFSGATDFVPEFNRWLQLVDMDSAVRICPVFLQPQYNLTIIWCHQFRLRLCVTMVLDYGGAWISDIVLKYFFGDTTPKELITRGSERREARRIAQKHEQELIEKVKKDE